MDRCGLIKKVELLNLIVLVRKKGGQVYETEYSCMVNEPVCLTSFINNF